MSKVKSAWSFPVLLLATAVIFVACNLTDSGSSSARSSSRLKAAKYTGSVFGNQISGNGTQAKPYEYQVDTGGKLNNLDLRGLWYGEGPGADVSYEVTSVTPADPAKPVGINLGKLDSSVLPTPKALGEVVIKTVSTGNDDYAGTTVYFKIKFTKKPDTTKPTILLATIESSSGRVTVTEGEKILITLTFSEPVKVAGTTPTIALTGVTPAATASYASGSASNKLLFIHTVAAGENGAISIPDDTTITNVGSIKSLGGTLTTSKVGTTLTGYVVDTAPQINSITFAGFKNDGITPKSGPLVTNDKVKATITFSENVQVMGTPGLKITIGTDTTKTFVSPPTYYQGTSGVTIANNGGANVRRAVFIYTVVSADTGAVSVPAEAFTGTITDDNFHDITYVTSPPNTGEKNSAAGTGSVTVDHPPRITKVVVSATAGQEKATVTVTFSEKVWIDGTAPTIQITKTPNGRSPDAPQAASGENLPTTSGTASDTLTFSYTWTGAAAAIGDKFDVSGVSITNSSSIKDADGTPNALGSGTLVAGSGNLDVTLQ